jgi:hypothetical protein
MQGIYRLAALGLAIGMCSPAVLAQAKEDKFSPPHQVEVAFNYSYMRANAAPGQCGCFNMTGMARVFRGRRSNRGVRGQLEHTRAVASPGFCYGGPKVHLLHKSLFPLYPVRPGSGRRRTRLRCALPQQLRLYERSSERAGNGGWWRPGHLHQPSPRSPTHPGRLRLLTTAQ